MSELLNIQELLHLKPLISPDTCIKITEIREKSINMVDFFIGMRIFPEKKTEEITNMVHMVINFLFYSEVSAKDEVMSCLQEAFMSFQTKGWTHINLGYAYPCHFPEQLFQNIIDIAWRRGILDRFDYQRFLGIQTYQIESREEEWRIRELFDRLPPNKDFFFKGIRPSQFLSEQITERITSWEDWSCFAQHPGSACNFLRWRDSMDRSGVLLVINRERLFDRVPYVFSGPDENYSQIEKSNTSHFKELRLLRKDSLRTFLAREWNRDMPEVIQEVIPLDCIEYVICFPENKS